MSIMGKAVGFGGPQADWAQTDATKADYIKNKPNVDVSDLRQGLAQAEARAQAALARSGGTMTGALNMGGQTLTGLAQPQSGSDAVTRDYAESLWQLRELELPRSGWSSAAPYFQTVNVPGITAEQVIAAITLAPGEGDAQAAREAFAKVSQVQTGAGYVTFTCWSHRPEGDCTVRLLTGKLGM